MEPINLARIAVWIAGATIALPPTAADLRAQSARDGNVVYNISSFPINWFTAGFASFTASSASVRDLIYQHWWFFRIDQDAQEFPFNNGDANGDGSNTQGFTWSGTGDILQLQWQDVDERGILTATLRLQAVSTGATSGIVTSRMTIRNVSNAPIRLNLFHYADIDLCQAANNVVVGSANGDRHSLTNPNATNCNDTAELLGIGIDRYEIDGYPRTRDRMLDAAPNDLIPGNLSFTGDYTGSFQWKDRTLNPGQTEVYTTVLSHNYASCPSESTATLYGTGNSGTNGVPVIATLGSPVVGATPRIEVTNALPSAIGTVVGGFGRTNQTIGNVTLWTTPIADAPIGFDAAGRGTLALTIPNATALCGAQVQFECLFVDPGVTGMFPIAHTQGLEWALGGY